MRLCQAIGFWVALLLSSRISARAAGIRLYVSSFQSGRILVIDPEGPRLVRSIPVEDGAGSIGLAVTSDGKKILVLDGPARGRLRTLDAATGGVLDVRSVANRALMLGSEPVVQLTVDDQWLLIQTHDPATAAAGERIFDLKTDTLLPAGLRHVACEAPRMAGARGALIAVCPGRLQKLKPSSGALGDFEPVATVTTTLGETADVALSPDGADLYVIGTTKGGNGWRLAHWMMVKGAVDERDLSDVLGADFGTVECAVRLSISPDGGRLAVAIREWLWMLDRSSLKVVGRAELPGAARAARFSPAGDLFLLCDTGGARGILRMSPGNSFPRRMALPVDLPDTPAVLEIAVAP